MHNPLNIIVAAMLGQTPGQGGWAWVVLQYLLGLTQLGHRVILAEPLSQDVLSPSGSTLAASVNARYFQRVLAPYGLSKQSVLWVDGTRETIGLSYHQWISWIEQADVLLNISGRITDLELVSRVPIRAYLDIDPAFTQLWQVAHRIDMHLEGHTHHATIGQAIGNPACTVPTCGIDWIATQPPVVLSHWPRSPRVKYNGLTTIANWRSYGSAEFNGIFYGQKVHSLRQFLDLPTRTDEPFMMALAIHPDEKRDLADLIANRWQLLDPARVAYTPAAYQQFIQGSKAEFGIAKSGYVESRCGWFSDRSVCYLASGRPVIAQETGFSRYLPTGQGLFAFNKSNDVLSAIGSINDDYSGHSQAARRIAEEYFDSDQVLSTLLRAIGAV